MARLGRSQPFAPIFVRGAAAAVSVTVTVDYASPVDFAATFKPDFSSLVDFRATLRPDALSRVDYGSTLQSDNVARLEFAGAAAFARFPIDWETTLQNDNLARVSNEATLAADAVAPFDFLQSLRSDGLVLSTLGATFNADGLSFADFGNALFSTSRGQIDSAVGIRFDAIGPVAINATLRADFLFPLEWSGIALVTIDSVVPLDFVATVRSDVLGRVEEAATLQSTQRARVEFGGSGASARFPIAFNATLQNDNQTFAEQATSLRQTGKAQTEIGATAQVTQRAPVDFLATLFATVRTRLEYLNSLLDSVRSAFESEAGALAAARFPLAFDSLLYANARLPVEWQGTAATVVTADGIAPIDFRATPRFDVQSYADFTATLKTDAIGRLELLSGVQQTYRERLEFGGSGTSARFPIDWLSSVRNTVHSFADFGVSLSCTARLNIALPRSVASDALSPVFFMATLQPESLSYEETGVLRQFAARHPVDFGTGAETRVVVTATWNVGVFSSQRGPIEWTTVLKIGTFGITLPYQMTAAAQVRFITGKAHTGYTPNERKRGN
jgi:hypothetical protein